MMISPLERIMLERADEQVQTAHKRHKWQHEKFNAGDVSYPPNLDRVQHAPCLNCRKIIKSAGRSYCKKCKERMAIGIPLDLDEYPTYDEAWKCGGNSGTYQARQSWRYGRASAIVDGRVRGLERGASLADGNRANPRDSTPD